MKESKKQGGSSTIQANCSERESMGSSEKEEFTLSLPIFHIN